MLGGTFTFPGTSMTVHRVGFGAMQLPGPGVYGPPKDHAEAIRVLREAIRLGIDHIDTSDFYGPHVANQLIAEALHPYPKNLVIVTKIGGKRGADKSWNPAYTKDELISAVHDNLRNLKVDVLDIVNLRLGAGHGAAQPPLEEMLGTVIDLQRQGHIRHIGLSNVTPAEFAQARKLTPVVCVQNWYNLVKRDDDAFIDDLAKQGVAYVPFFPVGGFAPLQSEALAKVAAQLNTSTFNVAQAWLLQRSPNMLLITGTSSVAHLKENAAVANLKLPPDALATLNALVA
ncbi:MAG: oxidoreductase [Alphaproteobacteria bacterium]|nr:oxidoreductase [Alphaproteobacteria bacterium]